MDKKLFREIVSQKYEFGKVDEFNYLGNKDAYQHIFACKDLFDIILDLNYEGNEVYTNEEGDRNLAAMYHYSIFTESQWDELIPQIFYRDFNMDFEELTKNVVPLFRPIKKFYDDLYLEFWQGIFSIGTHYITDDKELKERINSKKNGKLYCDTLLMIYPYFVEFLKKWPMAQFTLFRFAQCTGPHTYDGILFRNEKGERIR